MRREREEIEIEGERNALEYWHISQDNNNTNIEAKYNNIQCSLSNLYSTCEAQKSRQIRTAI